MLENATGRGLDLALACSIATLLLLVPANVMNAMTLQIDGVTRSTHIVTGLATSWRQGWPLVTIVLGLEGVVLPFVRFGLLSATLAAIRCGVRTRWTGRAFRYCQILDSWAMEDVLLVGAGIGYGRIATQISLRIDIGGWCFVAAAIMTMLTRASLERRAVWRRLEMPPWDAGPAAVAAQAAIWCCRPTRKAGAAHAVRLGSNGIGPSRRSDAPRFWRPPPY